MPRNPPLATKVLSMRLEQELRDMSPGNRWFSGARLERKQGKDGLFNRNFVDTTSPHAPYYLFSANCTSEDSRSGRDGKPYFVTVKALRLGILDLTCAKGEVIKVLKLNALGAEHAPKHAGLALEMLGAIEIATGKKLFTRYTGAVCDCDCQDHQAHLHWCKHIDAVWCWVVREVERDPFYFFAVLGIDVPLLAVLYHPEPPAAAPTPAPAPAPAATTVVPAAKVPAAKKVKKEKQPAKTPKAKKTKVAVVVEDGESPATGHICF